MTSVANVLVDPTFSSGTIANQIDEPQITVKSTTLYDGTDSHTVGGWTKVSQTRDSSNDATQDGSFSTGTTGVLSNAWDFTGGKVDLPHQALPTSGDYTYSTWVNFDSLSGNQEVLRSGDANQVEVWLSGGNNGLFFSGSSSSITLENTSSMSTGTWYNIVLVHSSSGDKAYLNGVEKSTSTIKTVPSLSLIHI